MSIIVGLMLTFSFLWPISIIYWVKYHKYKKLNKNFEPKKGKINKSTILLILVILFFTVIIPVFDMIASRRRTFCTAVIKDKGKVIQLEVPVPMQHRCADLR